MMEVMAYQEACPHPIMTLPLLLPYKAVTLDSHPQVHTTLVNGSLDTGYFGMRPDEDEALNNMTDILTTEEAAACFNSIGRYADPASAAAVGPRWKLFSRHALDDADLHRVFAAWEPSSVQRHAWDSPGAYPTSRPSYASLDASFILDESSRGAVLFPSALELGSSAMEVMAVAAKNAALLVAQKEMEKLREGQHEAEWAAMAGVEAGPGREL